jgi:endoplasmic reticulum resident protein 44
MSPDLKMDSTLFGLFSFRRPLILFLAFISLSCLIKAGNGSSVVQLTSANYDQLTASHEVVFINFYADWCRFSQILAPVFEEAYTNILKEFPDQGKVLFGKVDCETETDLSSRFHISKYPTLKTVMNGKLMKREFRGQRSIDAITKHLRELLTDPVHKVSTFDDYNKIEEKKGAIIGYFNIAPGATKEYNTYRKVATDLRDDCGFYWVTGEPSVSHLHDGKTNFVVFKPGRSRPGERDMIYPGGLQSYDELSTWSTDKCIPLVREITFENAEELTEEGLPFLILFHAPDDKESVEAYSKVIHSDVFSEASSVNFLVADGVKFAHPLHHLGKSQKDLPLIAIDSFRHMYLFPRFGDISIPGRLKQFVQDLHSGKLHREFHFGPDPSSNQDDSNPGNNKIVTAPPESTFKNLAPSRSRYTIIKDEL